MIYDEWEVESILMLSHTTYGRWWWEKDNPESWDNSVEIFAGTGRSETEKPNRVQDMVIRKDK